MILHGGPLDGEDVTVEGVRLVVPVLDGDNMEEHEYRGRDGMYQGIRRSQSWHDLWVQHYKSTVEWLWRDE